MQTAKSEQIKQADLSLRQVYEPVVSFVMLWLKYIKIT